MSSSVKVACLVYVAATATMRLHVRGKLEIEGYKVREFLVSADQAMAAQSGEAIPEELAECIRSAELCVFLLPEDASQEAGLEQAIAAADAQSKRIICVVTGTRTEYPTVVDDNAESVLREGSSRLAEAIAGQPAWELPGGALRPVRQIARVRCQ